MNIKVRDQCNGDDTSKLQPLYLLGFIMYLGSR